MLYFNCVVAVCVLCLFLVVTWVGLWSVTVVFSGQTHSLKVFFDIIDRLFTGLHGCIKQIKRWKMCMRSILTVNSIALRLLCFSCSRGKSVTRRRITMTYMCTSYSLNFSPSYHEGSYVFIYTPGRRRSKTLLTIDERGSKISKTLLSIAICRQSCDKWQLKSLFLTIFDLRSSMVLTFSIAAYPV